MINRIAVLRTALAFATLGTAPLWAAEANVITLTIKEHRFQPDRIEVAAGKEFVLLIRNEDATPEEFESHDLNREKVIQGHTEAKVKVGALKPGEYSFVGEFNEATATGVIVAK
ncbi:MAG: cupredoxin domain-containing protein [Gammaproteobacteria bacterium]